MSWLYEKSATWRFIVQQTRRSPLLMGAFTIACLGLPYALGSAVMSGTGSYASREEKELRVRQRQTLHSEVLARAQRERLAVLLEEVKHKRGGDERYAASLDGRSLGTHSSGTTTGAKAIQDANAARKS